MFIELYNLLPGRPDQSNTISTSLDSICTHHIHVRTGTRVCIRTNEHTHQYIHTSTHAHTRGRALAQTHNTNYPENRELIQLNVPSLGNNKSCFCARLPSWRIHGDEREPMEVFEWKCSTLIKPFAFFSSLFFSYLHTAIPSSF